MGREREMTMRAGITRVLATENTEIRPLRAQRTLRACNKTLERHETLQFEILGGITKHCATFQD